MVDPDQKLNVSTSDGMEECSNASPINNYSKDDILLIQEASPLPTKPTKDQAGPFELHVEKNIDMLRDVNTCLEKNR